MAQDIEKVNAPKLPAKSIKLGLNDIIDLDGLPNDQVVELHRQHAAGMVELGRKAAEEKLGLAVLDRALVTMNAQASKAVRSNSSITVTRRQETSLGETEVKIINTPSLLSRLFGR